MERFTAHNRHSEASIRRLSRTQYDLFGMGKQIRILVTGAACLLVSVLVSMGDMYRVFLMMIGGWLLVSAQLPEKRQTEKMLAAINGKYPESTFTFTDDSFSVKIHGTAESLTYPYEKLVSIAEDDVYFYLFVSPFSGFMFPQDSLNPKSISALERFLGEKTGLLVLTPCPVLKLRIKEIRKRIQSVRTLRSRKKRSLT